MQHKETPCQGLHLLSLERILVSKLAANRAKDRMMIPVLPDALIARQAVNRRAKKNRRNKRK